MYSIIKLLSYLLRQFWIPNPFTNLVNDPNIAWFVNLAFESFHIYFAYLITRVWYDKKNRIAGSLGFFINYVLLTYIFSVITYFFTNYYIITVLFVLAFFVLCITEKKIFKEKYPF